MTKKILILASLLLVPALGHAQVREAGIGGNSGLNVGLQGSYFYPDYGWNKLIGVGGYAVYNMSPRIGYEAEIRFLRFNQLQALHEDTYLVGTNISLFQTDHGRVVMYGKGLVGIGEFNFFNNVAHGGYGVVAAGGGFNYHFKGPIYFRGDYEYQIWPTFVGAGPRSNGLTPNGASFGISWRVFDGSKFAP